MPQVKPWECLICPQQIEPLLSALHLKRDCPHLWNERIKPCSCKAASNILKLNHTQNSPCLPNFCFVKVDQAKITVLTLQSQKWKLWEIEFAQSHVVIWWQNQCQGQVSWLPRYFPALSTSYKHPGVMICSLLLPVKLSKQVKRNCKLMMTFKLLQTIWICSQVLYLSIGV